MTKEILEAAQKIIGRILRPAKKLLSREVKLRIEGNEEFISKFERDISKFVIEWLKSQKPRNVSETRKPKTHKDEN